MPYVNIKVLKGAINAEQKADMIRRVSEVIAEIEASPHPKEKIVPHVTVIIDEVDFENWGAGGVQVTPEMLKAILES
jgi:4-oxalocrotonate tautomerase